MFTSRGNKFRISGVAELQDQLVMDTLSGTIKAVQLVSVVILVTTHWAGIQVWGWNGRLLPSNPFSFIGETLVINCTLPAVTYFNSSNLYFAMMNDVNVSSRYQSVISPYVLQLAMPISNGSLNDILISCFLPQSRKLEKRLLVDYPLRQVSNITVVVHDWKNISISWQPGTYLHQTRIHTRWTDSRDSSTWKRCSEANTNYCFLDHDAFKENTLYNVSIDVFHKLGNRSIITLFDFNSDDLVKPAAVSSVEVREASSSCVYLEWTHDKYYSRSLAFRATLQHGNKAAIEHMTNNMSIACCNLTPDTEYSVFVSAKPTHAGYWSVPESLKLRTLEDRPSQGVKVTEGSFSVENCQENLRNVLVFLVLPDKDRWNGKLTNYRLTYVSSDGSHNITSEPPVDLVYDRVKLVCNLDYDVYISVFTRIGGSPPSHLHIPREGAVKQPSDVRIRRNLTISELVWEAEGVLRNWTLYWCNGATHTCQEEIRWKMVNSSQTVVSFDYETSNEYGVSISTDNGSSGIIWADCNYDVKEVPGPPEPVTVINHPDLSLTVRWELEKCVRNTFISNYTIQHCRRHDTNCLETVVPTNSNELVIRDLEGGVNYTVRMRQRSDSGKFGPFSQPVFAVTKVDVSKSLMTALAVGVSVSILIQVAIVYCIRNVIRKLSQKEEILLPSSQVFISKQHSRHDNIDPTLFNRPYLFLGDETEWTQLGDTEQQSSLNKEKTWNNSALANHVIQELTSALETDLDNTRSAPDEDTGECLVDPYVTAGTVDDEDNS